MLFRSKEHPQADRPTVPRRPEGGTGQGRQRRKEALPPAPQAGHAEIPGPGLRLRQLPGHRLPRAAPAGAGSSQAPVRHPAIGAGAGAGPRAAGRGPVLRHRDRGIPRPDRAGGHVADGPPDEPARGRTVRRERRAPAAEEVRDDRAWQRATNQLARYLHPPEFLYIFGNPPFIGSKMITAEQRADLLAIAGPLKGAGVLDFVSAWYLKAAAYLISRQIGRAHVCTPVTNAQLVCRLL